MFFYGLQRRVPTSVPENLSEEFGGSPGDKFTLVSGDCGVACLETLETGFAGTMARLGIDLLPATPGEVDRLEANLLSLGGSRVVAPAGETRINRALRKRGYELIEVEIDQFVRCGGGVHCLTMPLGRIAPRP